MTTATIFSNLSVNQNAFGVQSPPNTIVDAGSPIDRASATLTVTPSTGWAEASIQGGFDGLNWIGAQEIFVSPNAGGTQTVTARFAPHRYVTAVLVKVSPGALATLTVTY